MSAPPETALFAGRIWSTPNGIRTRVTALKGRGPRPLADGGARAEDTGARSRPTTSRRRGRRPPAHLQLRFAVDESDGAVDADRHVLGIGAHHERLGAQLVEPVPADVMDQRAREAAAAPVAVRVDGLEPGHAGAVGEQSHRGAQRPVHERAEPAAATRLGEVADRAQPARAELAVADR